ncbi:MAG: sterol-binding protein, partial [Betaproteobacteria bacterium]|nr:sterol-binding protein [Betaproteobacteria bacterium]
MAFEAPFVHALNHLLEAEPWARERLTPFAGETVELRAPPLPRLRFAIAAGGRLGAAPAAAAPALTVTLGSEALPAAAQSEEHLLRSIEVAGNAKLAAEVMFLARHLRWDVEEDLAQVVGDALAHRLLGCARALAAWHADAARRVLEGLVEYATEERRLLVPRAELESLAAAGARLRDALERLEKRIERLG